MATTRTQDVDEQQGPTPNQAPAYVGTRERRAGARSLSGYVFIPALLAGVLLALYLWVSSQELDSIEARRVNFDFLLSATQGHLVVTAVSTVLVLAISIPTGILLTRPFARRITPTAIAFFNIGQGVPSIGLIALLAYIWTTGFWTAVVALVAYSALSVLRNTMVGLQQVDQSVIEAARGMGMTRLAVLTRIELPLAVPVIMAGVRTALVINVGTATLATFIGVNCLGRVINTGIVNGRDLITIVGSVLVIVLALLIDYLAGIAEDRLRPRGL